MYEAVQQCKHCGAGLSLEDLRLPNCKFCKTVFPHHAQAAQHAQVASQMMGQMMQQQADLQNQWRGAFGVGPMPPGPPGGPPPGAAVSPLAFHQAGMAQANAMSRMIIGIVIASLVVVFLMVGVGIVFFVAR